MFSKIVVLLSSRAVHQSLVAASFQKVHARILGIWAVKMVVIAIFSAFTLASIVSSLLKIS